MAEMHHFCKDQNPEEASNVRLPSKDASNFIVATCYSSNAGQSC